jgi:hypothetical protein
MLQQFLMESSLLEMWVAVGGQCGQSASTMMANTLLLPVKIFS